MYDARDNSWESFGNIANHDQIMNRTGHCALPTSRGCLFIGGLREDEEHSDEVISLDLFSLSSPSLSPSLSSSFSSSSLSGSLSSPPSLSCGCSDSTSNSASIPTIDEEDEIGTSSFFSISNIINSISSGIHSTTIMFDDDDDEDLEAKPLPSIRVSRGPDIP
jgi:hypothetical protein